MLAARPRKGRRLGLFWACILASALTLLTGRSLFDFGWSAADASTESPVVGAAASTSGEDLAGDSELSEAAGMAGEQEGTGAGEGAHPEGEQAAHAEGEEQAHSGGHGGHSDPVAPVLLWLVIILICAKLGGDLFDRIGQPAVLGELVAGVVVGNALFFLGHEFMAVLREGTTLFGAAEQIATGALDPRAALEAAFPGDPQSVERFLALYHADKLMGYVELSQIVDIFSRVGVIILLFLVGLESNLQEMLRVGVTSFLVAVVGVVAPFLLGFGASAWFLSGESFYVHIFVGATLCATSVGITARVFKDLNKLQTTEAKIILGAAVIDDVLGLIILAITQGIIIAADAPAGAEGPGMALTLVKITMLSVVFIGGSIIIGIKWTPFLTRLISKMRVPGMKLIYSLAFAFLLAWLADLIGLATIVGAFAAGLVLEEAYFKDFSGEHHHIEELIEPIATVLVPVFFVLMGIQVKLETFANVSILGIAAGITVAAIIGKQVCGLVVRDPEVSRTSIGVGMIPRGEVGLIFAAIGKTLTYQGQPVINSGVFSAVVIMVIVTTLLTPPVLKITMKSVGEGSGRALGRSG